MPKILISSCLIGINTSYKETSLSDEHLINLVKQGQAIFFCPEQIGGLPTPRNAVEIEYGKTAKDVLEGNGRVLTKTGEDFTKQFVKGANYALELCKKFDIKIAILKSKSPSCSSQTVYDGTYTRNSIIGMGITAQLLTDNGVNVYDEESYPKDL